MRGHSALISASKKQSIKEHDQESINGGTGLEFDEDSGANSYGLRENPKKSWRVSNSNSKPNRISDLICKQCGKGFYSLRALASHMKSHSLKNKESTKENRCTKCGKGFDSLKALYGHMRCHTIKKSQPSNQSSSSSYSPSSEDGKLHGSVKNEISNPIRRKRSCTRYNPAKHNDLSSCTSLSSFASIGENNDGEVEEGALCLMMLSRGLGGGKMKEVISESGSGQFDMDLMKKGKRKVCNDTNLRRLKDHKCPICFKGFGSGQALDGHKKAHYNVLTKIKNGFKEEIDDSFDICGCLDLERGVENDMDMKLRWVPNDIEWDDCCW
ncbi:hypothetical protein L1887_36525 [Cichorium endivia]|nr:hypothetical protein L1887_36525 [Cichorium endivia]